MNEKIISKPYSSEYSNGWERCFLKKPQEWLDSLYPKLIVRSHDGFRDDTWEKRMSKSEFENRLTHCTLCNTTEVWAITRKDGSIAAIQG